MSSLFFLLAGSASALTTFIIPPLGKANTPTHVAMMKNIKDDIRVLGTGFQVTIPKGWTIQLFGEGDQFFGQFQAYPTEFIQSEKVSFSVNRRKSPQNLSAIKLSLTAKGRVVNEDKGVAHQSLQNEYSAQGRQNTDWFVNSKSGNFVVIGGAPVSDKNNLGALKTIFSSLAFN